MRDDASQPVGGSLPKLYAALRRGRRVVLVPEGNRGEMEEAITLLLSFRTSPVPA